MIQNLWGDIMRAVIYARYSSDRQTEQSIEGQVRDCMSFAEAQGIEVLKVYADRAISGKTDDRGEFQQMIEDSETGEFSVVIVYKLDRFSRNRYDSAIYKSRLKKNGVKVLSAKENIMDSPEGVILESLLEGMAEYYSLDLAQKTTRGLRESALKCQHTGGRPLLGYKVNADKSYSIDESAAPTVREIFRLYLQGKSYNNIIDILNKKGAKTGAGRSFGKNSIHELLKNERYVGVYVYNRIPRTEDGKRNSHASKSENVIRVEGGIPAIIDRETWEEVQKKMAYNKKSPARNKAKVEYLLSGKLYCGHCGGAMVGQSSTLRGVVYTYYVCNRKVRLRTCDKHNVKKNEIEDLVVNITVEHVLNDKSIMTIADQVSSLSTAEAQDDSRIKNLAIQLKSTKDIVHNICSAIAQGVVTSSTKQMLEEAETKRDLLELQIAQEKVIEKHPVTREQMLCWLDQFKGGSPEDPEYRRKLIDTFVNSVFVYDDKLIITYNYSGDDRKVELSLLEASFGLDTEQVTRTNKSEFIFFGNVFGILLRRSYFE